MKRLLNIILFLSFSFVAFVSFCPERVFATSNDKTLIKINQSNFLDEFYYNEKLLGDEGKNYIVEFDEDIDLNQFANVFVKSFTPIGTQQKPLTALILGNNKKLHNLKLTQNKQEVIAIFGFVNTKICNLIIKNMQLSSKDVACGFCISAQNSIFENITIDNVVINADYCMNFCKVSTNSFYKNVEINLTNNALECGYKFAQEINNDGFKNVSVCFDATCEIIDDFELQNWGTDMELKFSQLNGLFEARLTTTEDKTNAKPNKNFIYYIILASFIIVFICAFVLVFLNKKHLTRKK